MIRNRRKKTKEGTEKKTKKGRYKGKCIGKSKSQSRFVTNKFGVFPPVKEGKSWLKVLYRIEVSCFV
jgi:hypothetical protein